MPRRVVLLAILLAAASGAAAQVRSFTTSDGTAVPTPAPEALDCGAMREVLDAIDATGYRRGGPSKVARGDRALLDYENALSSEHFRRCVESEALKARPESAFAGGYSGEDETETER